MSDTEKEQIFLFQILDKNDYCDPTITDRNIPLRSFLEPHFCVSFEVSPMNLGEIIFR